MSGPLPQPRPSPSYAMLQRIAFSIASGRDHQVDTALAGPSVLEVEQKANHAAT